MARFKQFPQDLIQTNGASYLGIVQSSTIRNFVPVGLLMYEQSFEKKVHFQGFFKPAQNHI